MRLGIKLENIQKHGQRAGAELLALAEGAYMTFLDPHLPRHQKALVLSAMLYFLSPLDAVPDFLPGGFLDDIPVLLGAIAATGVIGHKHVKESREKRGLAKQNNQDKES